MPVKTYRFFYHYNKQTGGMTVHYKGKCHPTRFVACMTNSVTKYNKTQPRLVMQGYASHIDIADDTITIHG